MSQATRNDAKALRIIEMLYIEGVSPENITRLLNHHFTETYACSAEPIGSMRHVIRRVPEGHNFAPAVEIWKTPK